MKQIRKIDPKEWNPIKVKVLPLDSATPLLQCLKDETLYFDLTAIAKKAKDSRVLGFYEQSPTFFTPCEFSFSMVHNKNSKPYGEIWVHVEDSKPFRINSINALNSKFHIYKKALNDLLDGETILEILPVTR